MCVKLPSRLSNCPIIDALVELRFESNLNKSLIFGYMYKQIVELYPHEYPSGVISLPVLQIPEAIRNSDPNMRFKPLYRLEGKSTIIQIGNDVLCISPRMPYYGWNEFEKFTVALIDNIFQANIISRVVRLGHRYINFFEGDIIHNLTLELKTQGPYALDQKMMVRSEVADGNFTHVIQVSNNARYKKDAQSVEILGSILDIDTSREYLDKYFQLHFSDELNQAHNSEKKLFFSLLVPAYIDTLKPVYDE